ncbi:MAG: serine protease [Burkholderiales bacterium]|jgi:hypothetical protein|nr:serine protease [Burkholderiales bacterium]
MGPPVQDILSLRVTDQETARVVAVHRANGEIVGAGCLIDSSTILTCRHVVAAALHPAELATGQKVAITLAGIDRKPTVWGTVKQCGADGPENDLALLEITTGLNLVIPAAEFASPLRHYGKEYSVLGFPGGDRQGRNAAGRLHAADTKGLVQMDRGGALSVLGGFSGAPVWCPALSAFVGLVVTELADNNVSWCIPSRRLCRFYPDLRVRFRVPPVDRPQIHDYWEDDPNLELFGTISDNGSRRLSVTIKEYATHYRVAITYECTDTNAEKPRGHYVTFINYPDFELEEADAYELFAPLKQRADTMTWYAEQWIEPDDLFTIAAIGDAGDTALTLDLKAEWEKRKKKKKDPRAPSKVQPKRRKTRPRHSEEEEPEE